MAHTDHTDHTESLAFDVTRLEEAPFPAALADVIAQDVADLRKPVYHAVLTQGSTVIERIHITRVDRPYREGWQGYVVNSDENKWSGYATHAFPALNQFVPAHRLTAVLTDHLEALQAFHQWKQQQQHQQADPWVEALRQKYGPPASTPGQEAAASKPPEPEHEAGD